MNSHERRYIMLGLKIAYYRKSNGLSQSELSELVHITPKYLSLVESPTTPQPISLPLLFDLADVFHIPPKRLLDFDEDE